MRSISKEEMRNQKMNKIILAFIYYREENAATFVSEKLLYLHFLCLFAFILHYYVEGVKNFITSCIFYTLYTYLLMHIFKKYKKKGLSIKKIETYKRIN